MQGLQRFPDAGNEVSTEDAGASEEQGVSLKRARHVLSSDLKSLLGPGFPGTPVGSASKAATLISLFPWIPNVLCPTVCPGLPWSQHLSDTFPNLPTLLRAFATQFNTVSQTTSGTLGL